MNLIIVVLSINLLLDLQMGNLRGKQKCRERHLFTMRKLSAVVAEAMECTITYRYIDPI